MDDTSKLRMNLSAIKKVDPYAKDIVDTSPHVAFYTFNSEKNEWEKTDVEGAFFVYSRNAQPYHSVFINNRLNTTSFVEPVTGQLELQSQPPFLLYRNERSRIRGFWFYNSEECDRIGTLLKTLVEQNGGGIGISDGDNFTTSNQNNNSILNANGTQEANRVSTPKQSNVNIFNMLSKAQQEYNNAQAVESNLSNTTSGSVLKFFAAAKPTIQSNSEMPGQPVLPLLVEQIEQQQRTQTPVGIFQQHQPQTAIPKTEPNLTTHVTENFILANMKQQPQQSPVIENNAATPFQKLFNQANFKKCTGPSVINAHAATVNEVENQLRNLLVKDVLNASATIQSPAPSTVSLLNSPLASSVPKEFNLIQKPALMPPTMFERTAYDVDQNHEPQPQQQQQQSVLNQSQMVQALIHLMQNDQDFVQKLHDAYVKVSTSKTLVESYQ